MGVTSQSGSVRLARRTCAAQAKRGVTAQVWLRFGHREGGVIDIRRWCVAAALSAGVLLSPFTAAAQQKIKLGLLPFSESLAAVIADKQGYFKEQGLEVEIAKFDSAAIAVPVLQSGRMDIVLSSTVSTFQAIEQGLDAVVLAPGAIVRTAPPDTTTAVMARKGAIQSPKDLEGKRIGVNVINS